MAIKFVQQMKRHRVLTTGVVGVLAAVLAVVAVLSSGDGGKHPPKPVSTISSNTRVCLIAKAGDPDAIRIWAGVEQAAEQDARVNAQQTEIPAAAASSPDEVLAYAGGLAQEHCAIIIAVGDALHDAVQAKTGAAASAYIYVSQYPISMPSIVYLSPEQATTTRIATETTALLNRVHKP